MRSKNVLILLGLVHAQIGEQLAALGNLGKQTLAGGVIFLVLLQVLGEHGDLGREDRDLDLRRARVFAVGLVFLD